MRYERGFMPFLNRIQGIMLLALVSALAQQACSPEGTAGSTDAAPDTQDARLPGQDAAFQDGSQETSDGQLDAQAGQDAGPGDAGEGDGGSPWIVPPVSSCAPVGSPCDPVTPDPGIFATYRKDFYLPASQYSELNDDPVDGGRFHLAAVAAASGAVVDVRLNGESADSLLVEPELEWYHVWPDPTVAGEPVWVAFHSRSSHWDTAATGQIVIETTGGDAVSGTFLVQETPTPLTYVTTTGDYGTLLVHLQNTDAVAHTLTRLLVNGRDRLGHGACVPDPLLEPGETVMWSVPLCAPTRSGAAWTVVAELQGAPPAVGVGRVLRPHFPVEGWPSGADCPFPGGDQANLDNHLSAGFDTLYMYWGGKSGCSYDPAAVVNQLAPALGDLKILIGDDFLTYPDPGSAITDTSAVAGFLTGDESDGEVYENGVPRAAAKAARARQLWAMYPEVTVYNGAMTNRNIGSFAGMADVQGIDFYAAACAPHITTWGTHPPLRGPYDYLRNARNNHMPLPTWLYSQGLASVWNKEGLLGGTIHVQPDPQEILTQAFMVMAAGGKGLMWFMTSQSEAGHAPARWNAMAAANWMFRGVRRFLREGDVTGRAAAGPDAIVELIRSPEALVVPLINLKTVSEPTDIGCAGSLISEASVPHWELDSQVVDVVLDIPDDFGVRDWFEVTADQVLTPANAMTVSGRSLVISGVGLDGSVPVRLFVLAAHGAVRGEVASLLSGP